MLASLAKRFRQNRARHFVSLLAVVPTPIRILDIGGTEAYWEQIGLADSLCAEVILLTLSPVICRRPNFIPLVGDTRYLNFADHSFDVVFSNSVIEHVGTLNDQRRMAQEVQRVGRRYYVQTPNRYFPIEPHFLLPLFQFYPQWLKVWAVTHLGFSLTYGRLERRHPLSTAETHRMANSIRLVTMAELQQLFPDALIWRERLGLLDKSYVAYYGWDES